MLRVIKKILGIIVSLVFVGGVLFILAALYYAKDLPDPQRILQGGFKQSTKIYDRTGTVLIYQIGDEHRDIIDINQLPPFVKEATITAEDAQFYEHPGIDFLAILRSLVNDLRHQALIQGGSTITQQFVKNAILSPEKTFSRKIKEVVLSVWLEARYSKDQILGFYLNQIPYGSNAYGIESAARTFFGKSSQDLTLGEAALLVSLPQRPSYLSPFGEHKNELKARQENILDRMVKAGYIREKEATQAKEEKLLFRSGGGSILAPHFVMYIKEYLEKTYGPERVEQGGLRVITTLDWRLQEKAQAFVLEQAKKNEKQYRAKNAALVAIDPKTGQVLSMVGSRDWFDDSIDGKVNVALRLRQPGSSFKPYIYAKLFEQGFAPESLIFDLETVFQTRAKQSYKPRNYTGKFHGLLTMRQALGQSINIPAVKALYLAGIPDAISLVKQMGISTINPDKVDLALVLGGAEVKLLEHTSAYGAFANDGIYNPPGFILKIEDKERKVLEKFSPRAKKVLDPEITRLITSILSDNETRAPLFGANSPLFIPGVAAAAKTGTTSDFKDGWTMGYTPSLAVGVWAGNNDNSSTKNGEGAFIAGPIWNKLTSFAVKTYPDEFGGAFPEPLPHSVLNLPMVNGKVALERIVQIDAYSGKLATSLTPPLMIEQRPYREVHSLLYYVRPSDPQLAAWEEPIKSWARTQSNTSLYIDPPPSDYDDVHTIENIPLLAILSPLAFTQVGSSLPIEFSAQTKFPLKQIEISLDNDLVKTISAIQPLDIDISGLSQGSHTLTLKIFDAALNTKQESAEFTKIE